MSGDGLGVTDPVRVADLAEVATPTALAADAQGAWVAGDGVVAGPSGVRRLGSVVVSALALGPGGDVVVAGVDGDRAVVDGVALPDSSTLAARPVLASSGSRVAVAWAAGGAVRWGWVGDATFAAIDVRGTVDQLAVAVDGDRVVVAHTVTGAPRITVGGLGDEPLVVEADAPALWLVQLPDLAVAWLTTGHDAIGWRSLTGDGAGTIVLPDAGRPESIALTADGGFLAWTGRDDDRARAAWVAALDLTGGRIGPAVRVPRGPGPALLASVDASRAVYVADGVFEVRRT